MRSAFLLASTLMMVGCGAGAPGADAGRAVADGGDAGARPPDAGLVDAGPMDAGLVDAGLADAGLVDAGLVDAGLVDAGLVDAGARDAGVIDAGAPDAGGPSGPSCVGLPDVVTFDFVWATSSSVLTSQVGGVRPGTIVVGRLTVPPTATMPSAQAGQVRFVEYIDGQAQRQMTVSAFPCDFRGFIPGSASRTDPTGLNFPMTWSNDINTQIIFQLTPPGTVVLQPGRTWYVNLRNVDWVTGMPSCQTASCNGLFNFFAPR